MSRVSAGILLALLLGGILWWGSNSFSKSSISSLSITGTIEAMEVDVSSKVSGQIDSLLVDEGREVEKGAVLVKLDSVEMEAQVEKQKALVQMAEMELRDLLAGARKEEIDETKAAVERANANLNNLLAGARKEEIEQAKASWQSINATRILSEQDFKRAKELYSEGFISAGEVDKMKEAYEVAKAKEYSAKENLKLIKKGARFYELEGARADVKASNHHLAILLAGARPNTIEAAKAKLSQAKAVLKQTVKQLKDTVLYSPIRGVVLHKGKENGEVVKTGEPVLTLIDLNDIWVRGYIPEDEIGLVKIGTKAQVKIDSLPQKTFYGEVTEIASQVEFTPKNVQTKKERVNLVFRVKVRIKNEDGILKPGMPADVELKI